MKIIEQKINEKPFYSKVLAPYFANYRVAVADIETTGLSPIRNEVVLGGILFLEGNTKRMVQIFADSRKEEEDLLKAYMSQLYKSDVVITYNGTGFDLPFLKKRMVCHGIDPDEINNIYHIDILKILRRYSDLREILPDLKQKTVEKYYGEDSERADEIDGAESVRLYFEYCKASGMKADSIRNKILLHNRDDIVRLSNLTKVIRQLDIHEIMYHEGWPGVKSIRIESGMLRINSENQTIVPVEHINGHFVADLIALDIDIPQLRRLPGYESGFLDLGTEKKLNYMEVNKLAIEMSKKYG